MEQGKQWLQLVTVILVEIPDINALSGSNKGSVGIGL